MIAKGTTHNNGARLAAYMMNAKEGERVELGQLRGFASENIRDAFRDVDVMAAGTQIRQPFFHVQVRNPEGEVLTRTQWERVADRIESKLGLSGQSRAIVFHINQATGHEHMHLAWSRIDEETMQAKRLPFFKYRLKEVSRELELQLGLTRVRNEIEGAIEYGPTRAEDEQARRLGVDIRQVRTAIRDCYDRSDNGRSFEAALADQGLILARGEQRDFVVVDHAGGLHALGQRILGVKIAQVRERLSDLPREELPTVEQVRTERGAVQREAPAREVWDRDAYHADWNNGVTDAAIAQDRERARRERSNSREANRGGRKKRDRWPVAPEHSDARNPNLFAAAERQTVKREARGREGLSKHIHTYFRYAEGSRKQFRADLDERGVELALVSKEDADRSHREASFARALGRTAQTLRAGEIVAVTTPRPLRHRNGEWAEPSRVHRLNQDDAKLWLKGLRLEARRLKNVEVTTKLLEERGRERAEKWLQIRTKNATRRRGKTILRDASLKAPVQAMRIVGNVASKPVELLANLFEDLLAPKITPVQRLEGEAKKLDRETQAEHRRLREQDEEPQRRREREPERER